MLHYKQVNNSGPQDPLSCRVQLEP